MFKIKPLSILLPLSLLLLLQCGSTEDKNKQLASYTALLNSNPERINGVSFVSPPDEFSPDFMKIPKQQVAANWLCFMPFGFIQSSSNEVQFNSKWQWWGEKSDGVSSMIKMAQRQKYKVMLKPQIWIRHGEFTGHHKYEIEEDWRNFEDSYSQFILTYARIADSLNVEIFCIGTELEQFVLNRPQYWTRLIQKIKKIYSGKITYAANWDEFKRTPFWKELDFIGIDGYFPLNDSQSPSIEDLRKAWKPHKKLIKTYADSLKRPILFTEYGFRSRDFSTSKPWESDRGGNINLSIQSKAYEAFFQEVWQEDYFAGGFLWKWFPNYYEVGGQDNTGYTPQRKPVEKVIKRYYGLDTSD